MTKHSKRLIPADEAVNWFTRTHSQGIYRYTPEIQRLLGSKVKAEPWLHITCISTKDGEWYYGIYVWDTRVVLESKQIDEKLADKAFEHIRYANDNREFLQGDSEIAILFNIIAAKVKHLNRR